MFHINSMHFFYGLYVLCESACEIIGIAVAVAVADAVGAGAAKSSRFGSAP